ncbi:MAG TPA: outer membrane beta-barrel protein [Xanthobacteraceae bacterium]
MTRFLLASAAFAAFIATAPAAELSLKAPRLPASPALAGDWNGPYVGLALGGKWADTTWTTTSTSDPPNPPLIVDASSPRNYRPSGFRAGGYAGYNWQIAGWVWGVEADLAWADKTAAAAGIPGCAIGCFPGAPGPGVDVASVEMRWDASARVRLGVLLRPSLLLYSTGGAAWQSVETSGTCQHSLSDPACTAAVGNPFDTRGDSKILTGGTVGGGVETMYGNWLLRAEYRYARFGKLNGALDFQAAGVPPGADTSRYNLSVETHVATVGLAYRFGAPAYGNY